MLGVRLAGCGILALEAESKNAVNILHELVYLASCGFISLHIGVRHDLSVDLTEFLVICLELLLILILLGSLMLEGHLNKLDLGDKLVESGIGFVCLLSLHELGIALVLLQSCAELSCFCDYVHFGFS